MIETQTQAQATQAETTPPVSVIIPAYNAAKYIGEALKSVREQTFTAHETIVINDGSPDAEELERELEAYEIGVRYIKQNNRGAAAARNAGLRVAQGEFVAFLDADDRWLPNFLEEQLAFLKSSNVDFVFADASLFGESALSSRTFMQLQPSRGMVTPESLLDVSVAVLTSAVLARKGPILDAGLFDESFKRGHDFDLWLRLARLGVRFAYQRKVLAEHRIVETGLSGDTISQLLRTVEVLEAIKAKEPLTPSEEAAFEVNLNRTLTALALEKGKEKLLARDFAGALDSFREAKKIRRTWKLTAVTFAAWLAPETLRHLYTRRTEQLRSASE